MDIFLNNMVSNSLLDLRSYLINLSADAYSPDKILRLTLLRLNGTPGGKPDDDNIILDQANLLTWLHNTVLNCESYSDCFKATFVKIIQDSAIGSISFEKNSKENRYMQFSIMELATGSAQKENNIYTD